MCMHFDNRDHFIQGLAATSAITALVVFVVAARTNRAAQYDRVQTMIDDMVAWSSVEGSGHKAVKYARELVEA